jgi:hypothetical protein
MNRASVTRCDTAAVGVMRGAQKTTQCVAA